MCFLTTRFFHVYRNLLQMNLKARLRKSAVPFLTHRGLDGRKVWRWKGGGRCAVGGVNGWVSGDGGGATPAVRIFNVPAAVAASTATLL